MAYPLLYRTVQLWNETAMYLFVRTLCRKPEYGFWTRYFACHITLTAPSVIRKIHGLFFHSTYLTTTTLGFHRLINCFPRYKLGFVDKIGNIYKLDKDNDFPQVLLWLILNLLAKVETVLLQVPITDKEWRRDKVIKAIENKFQRQSQVSQRLALCGGG